MKKCIICDVDGTLAEMIDRKPYDWHKVHTDIVKPHVRDIVNRFYDTHEIIIFTGRDGVCAEATEKWLKDNDINYHQFYSRAVDNYEKDSIIKERLFNNHVKDKYDVDFVLDDRNQVVNMWRRKLGLNCLQIQEGNF